MKYRVGLTGPDRAMSPQFQHFFSHAIVFSDVGS
jgi:hypothetical protein